MKLITLIAGCIIGATVIGIGVTSLFTAGNTQNQEVAKQELAQYAQDMKYQVIAQSVKPDSNHDFNVSVTIRYNELNADGTVNPASKEKALICNYAPKNFGGGGCRDRTAFDSMDY